MAFFRCRRGTRKMLAAAVIILFLLGCYFGVSRLTEVDAALEAKAGEILIVKQAIKDTKQHRNDDTHSRDTDHERRFMTSFPKDKGILNKNESVKVNEHEFSNDAKRAIESGPGESIPVVHAIKSRMMNMTRNQRGNSNLKLSGEIQKSKSKINSDAEQELAWPAPNYNLHIFYYPWYGSPAFDRRYLHWNHQILQHWNKQEAKKWPSGRRQPPGDIGSNFYPDLGCYSSRNPSVIEEHMKQLRLAGVGVLSISWYPAGLADEQGQPWDDLISSYLDAAEKFGLKLTFHSEPYKERTELTFLDDIHYIIDHYGNHPAFYRQKFKDRDLPMFYVYDSYLTKATNWARLFSQRGDLSVRNSKYDGIFLGLYVETQHRRDILEGQFDGFYTYFASNHFTYSSRWQNWKILAEFARQRDLLFVPSVGPGYVDTRVRPWNNVNTRGRDNGNYYDRAFQSALNVKPRIISVTSFNEWGEGTQIERAVPKTHNDLTYLDYGIDGPDKYLLLTQKWAKAFNGGR